MIRGYVAIVDGDSPLPDIVPDSTVCRKTAVKLTTTEDENRYEFYLSIDGTHYSFKVIGNMRTVDKRNIASGLLHIGFIVPKLDVVVSGNPKELEAFVCTLVAIKDIGLLLPKYSYRTHMSTSESTCQGSLFAEYTHHHTDCSKCPLPVYPKNLCSFCCCHVLACVNRDDAHEILNFWKIPVHVGDPLFKINSITVNSFPYLSVLNASASKLTEVPEAIGLLPCLKVLILSHNQLGQATDWSYLMTPFVRENLCELDLDGNGLLSFPEPILGLKNLKILKLHDNYLTELPTALRNLKSLSVLCLGRNKLITLPGWIYRMKQFSSLYTSGNGFHHANGVNNSSVSQLKPSDFETITVPSLFKTVARFIIANCLSFREYNIPATLMEYLEGAYYCRCDSIVFPNTTGHVVHCWIKAKCSDGFCDRGDGSLLPIAIPSCSYECYKLIESLLVATAAGRAANDDDDDDDSDGGYAYSDDSYSYSDSDGAND